LTPIIPNAAIQQDQQLSQQEGRRSVVPTREEIPVVLQARNNTDTNESRVTLRKKSAPLYIVNSIIHGTLVGWIWGNSYFFVPTLVTPYLGNAILVILLAGSMIALKTRYPKAWLLHWLSTVGCDRRGQPLIYDPSRNSWINDPIYSDDTVPRNESTDHDDYDDDDSTGNEHFEVDRDMDNVDIETGHVDRGSCDDDDRPSNHHVDNTLEQEMTSLLHSNRSSNHFRSRRNTAIVNGTDI
jgi:hypothetical protein